MDFSGKVALVTGGSQGVGFACVSELLNCSMKVCICDIKKVSDQDYENLPVNRKDAIIFQHCDVSSLSDFQNAFKRVISEFGRIDVVVNNAGIFNENEWEQMIGVNLIGVIHGTQLAFEYMNINSGGHGGIVVNTASNAALDPFELGPVYSACKHGVVGLTKSYGTDYHFNKTGVKVSAVCPGPVDTSLYHTFPEKCVDKKKAIEDLMMVRPIQPEVVAKALIQVLCEEKNGLLLRVDDKGLRYV